MVKSMALTAAVTCVLAMSAHAQSDVAGRWVGQEPAARGAADVVLQLTRKGSDVAGSVTIGENASQALLEGKVDGNALTFKTTATLNGKEISVLWDGKVASHELTLVRTVGAGGRTLPPLVLKRAP